jgi:hypothetical protein
MDKPDSDNYKALAMLGVFLTLLAGVFIAQVFGASYEKDLTAEHRQAVQGAAESFDAAYRTAVSAAGATSPTDPVADAQAAARAAFPTIDIDATVGSGDKAQVTKVEFTGPEWRRRTGMRTRWTRENGFSRPGERQKYCLYLPARLEAPTVMGPGPC